MFSKLNRVDHLRVVTGLTVACLLIDGGCSRRQDAILPPPKGDVKVSDEQPANPFTELVPGVLTRTWYEAESGAGSRIEVRDLLVAPGARGVHPALPGAAIVEVRYGTGVVTSSGKAKQIQGGSAFVIPEGERLEVENKGEVAMTLRVRVVRSK